MAEVAARAAAVVVVAALVFAAGVLAGRTWAAREAAEQASEAAAAPVAGDRALPLPPRTPGEVGGWVVRVEAADLDATRAVLAANQFNTAPPDGWVMVLLEVAVARAGEGSAVLGGSLRADLRTPAGRRYELGTGCGVLPRPLDVRARVRVGEVERGQWCAVVREPDVPKARMVVTDAEGEDAVWFRLRDPGRPGAGVGSTEGGR